MKVLIPAGGHGTRLWPISSERPKFLLPIAGKPLIYFILEKILEIREHVDGIILATNKKFEPQLREWMKTIEDYPIPIHAYIEPTQSLQDRYGANGNLQFMIERARVKEDVIVIASDNLFDFSLKELLKFYRQKRGSVVALKDVGDIERAKSFGVVQVDRQNKIIELEEKPLRPKSTLISTVCYVFPKNRVSMLKEFLKGNSEDKDNLGSFISWLSKRCDVFGFRFSEEWYDVGNYESYFRANLARAGEKNIKGDVELKDSVLEGKFLIEQKCKIKNSKIINSILYEGCEVVDSVVEDSILFPNTKITKCTIRESILDRNSRLEGMSLKNSVIGSYTVLSNGNRI